MLDLAVYHVAERRTSPGTFDFIDPATGQVVAVASPANVPVERSGAATAILGSLLRYRVFLILFALVSLPIFLVRLILGAGSSRSKESRPKLVVRRQGDESIVFTLRQSSGFMYDSRRVYDSQGSLIAHFRSRSKTTVRGGFAIVDLRGMADNWSDIGDRPWLGIVETAGDVFRVRLVAHREAGRIVLREPAGVVGANQPRSPRSRGECDVEAQAELHGDATSKVLVLAVALTLAWWPEP